MKNSEPRMQDIVRAELEQILTASGGRIGPQTLLDAARPKSSALHEYFEWDDEIAGDRYRLMQASALMRQWKGEIVKIAGESRKITFQSVRRVQSPQGQRGRSGNSYLSVEEIMASSENRNDMIRTVLRELMAYRKRYAEIAALSDVWQAIDDAVDLHENVLRKPRPKADPPNLSA